MRARARASWGLSARTRPWWWHPTRHPSQGPPPLRSQDSGRRLLPGQSGAGQGAVAASTEANRRARRRRRVVHVSPRPSDSGGARIERGFGRSEVATKSDLKGNYPAGPNTPRYIVTPSLGFGEIKRGGSGSAEKRVGNEGRSAQTTLWAINRHGLLPNLGT
jgi:hypothetical protein